MQIFGFQITRKTGDKPKDIEKRPASFVPPSTDDGSTAIAAGGYYGQYLDIDGDAVKTDSELIRKYRMTAEQPECDQAIEDIVNEAIVADDDMSPVEVNLDALEQPKSIKDQIRVEFDNVVKLLNFNSAGHEIFRRWYIDGRLHYHIIIDDSLPKKGIIELRPIDSLKIRKVREVKDEIDPATGAKILKEVGEYFVYQENTLQRNDVGLKISKDSVCYVPSGLLDSTRKKVLSHLHKAIKPVNQLRMMEDSLVIYRLARAPERRIFYIDVGNLPKGKAEEYLRGIMNQYRNKMVYDAQTGELRDDRKHMSMLEDFWLPRREGGRGTEISTLPGGENLGQIEDILFFQKKMYRSLNVPITRMETETGFNLGKSSEISRDELKFQKFINRLRKRFSQLFFELLRTQLLLKGVITRRDWDEFKEQIRIDFRKDSYFAESKNNEILRERVAMLDSVQNHLGKYYSVEWVRRNVLKQTDDEIQKMDEQIEKEIKAGVLPNPEAAIEGGEPPKGR
jgi:hypothetical protein